MIDVDPLSTESFMEAWKCYYPYTEQRIYQRGRVEGVYIGDVESFRLVINMACHTFIKSPQHCANKCAVTCPFAFIHTVCGVKIFEYASNTFCHDYLSRGIVAERAVGPRSLHYIA